MYDELSEIASCADEIAAGSILEILKRYCESISIFDMMDFTSQVIKENRYVQESYRNESQKSYIESFLMRVRDISKDTSDYPDIVDKNELCRAIETLRPNHHDEDKTDKVALIFEIASIYATFVLKDPIHPVGTPFPGSLKVEKVDGEFLCPVKDANRETPNAVCNICLAKQLDF